MRQPLRYLGLALILIFIMTDGSSRQLSNAQAPAFDKYSLWTNDTVLRGANVFQRRVYPTIDYDVLGSGTFGPPYTQSDFNQLAGMGANYVNLSVDGIYTVTPPYRLDIEAVDMLDNLVAMAQKADMFAVISFRGGPGRSPFTFNRDDVGDWFEAEDLVETLWSEQLAQDAWVEMWRETARRYHDNPLVVGYDLMVEPNANALLEIYDANEFYGRYSNTLYDWNPLASRIISAIREVDADTPILVGGMNWSSASWMPYLSIFDDSRIVYTIHQYDPHPYTHQFPDNLPNTYPGFFDTDYDGESEEFDQSVLHTYLNETLVAFKTEHQVAVAVNEFGITRFAPNAADFIADEIALFEEIGVNYAIWGYSASWPPLKHIDNNFNFLFGPDPNNLVPVENDLLTLLEDAWGHNSLRPSDLNK